MSLSHRTPSNTWDTKHSHLPLPTCGAMVSASGQGVFLKNLSVNLVQLKIKKKYSRTPKQEGSEKRQSSYFIKKYPNSGKGRSHGNRARARASKSTTFLNPILHPRQSFLIRWNISFTSARHLPSSSGSSPASVSWTLVILHCLLFPDLRTTF